MDDLLLTGNLDADLQLVHDRGAKERDVQRLLVKHAGWIERLARGRWRRHARAHAVVLLEDAENLVRAGIWSALGEYRYICSAGCQRRGRDWRCGTREEWEAHLAHRHAAAPVEPRNDVGRFVRISAVNAVSRECRPFYKLKRIAPRHADEVLPIEAVEHLQRRVLPGRDAEDDAPIEVAHEYSADLGLQLGELMAEAREHLAPAARRLLGRMLEGDDAADALAAEVAEGGGSERALKAAGRRAQSLLGAFAEKTWSSRT